MTIFIKNSSTSSTTPKPPKSDLSVVTLENDKSQIIINGTIFHMNKEGLHNDDGPAVVYRSGGVEWWYNGNYFNDMHRYAKAAGWSHAKLASYILNNLS